MMNSVANGRIVIDGIADRAFVQAAATDDGTALGAALWVVDDRPSVRGDRWVMREAHLGPSWTDEECLRALEAQSRRASRGHASTTRP